MSDASSIPVKYSCPLGSQCEEVKDGAIIRCRWHVRVRGRDMNTGEEVDEWRCAMNWLPMLLIENSGMQRATSVAVESFRNEMVKANEVNQQVLLAAIQDVPPAPQDMKVIEAPKDGT